MPVIGHAFAGLAVARVVSPSRQSGMPLLFWIPFVVALTYLPDVIAMMGTVMGLDTLRVPAHSILVAIGLSIPLGIVLSLMGRLRVGTGFLFTLLMLLLHDLLDFLQGTDRQLFWPFSDRPLLDRFLIHGVVPVGAYREAVLFGGLFILFLLLWWFRSKPIPPGDWRRHGHPRRSGVLVFLGYMLTIAVLTLAAGTHYVRSLRASQLERAEKLIGKQKYGVALQWIDQSCQYPSTPFAGIPDYLRGLAFQGIGEREEAEFYYLRSYRLDPWFFRCVAQLALFYADSEGTPAERSKKVAPYLSRLNNEFSYHPSLPLVVSEVEQKLSDSGTSNE